MPKSSSSLAHTSLREKAAQTPFFDAEIVQKYDIRGRYCENLFDKDAYLLGNALGGYLLSKDLGGSGAAVAIGHDCRSSSTPLKKALVAGLTDRGFPVIDLGMVSSPMVNICVLDPKTYGISRPVLAGVIITASHNPPPYNGFKITLQNGLPLFDAALKTLENYACFTDLAQNTPHLYESLSSSQPPTEELYVKFLLKHLPPDFSFLTQKKVVWDVGNGSCGKIVATLLKNLPGTHILINDRPDPTFPSHTPDPSQEKNIEPLRAEVQKQQADIGFALDMDGDRLGAIDAHGRYWNGDLLSYLFAEHVCQSQLGSQVYIDVKSSQAIIDRCTELKGQALLVPTGHASIKNLLKDNPTVAFAGEYSGHHYFPHEYCLVDDALFSALKLLFLNQAIPLVDRFITLKSYTSTPQTSLTFASHADKNKAMQTISSKVKAQKTLKIVDIDGIRATFDDGWWLIRASNTEPILTIRCEGTTPNALAHIQQHLHHILSSVK